MAYQNFYNPYPYNMYQNPYPNTVVGSYQTMPQPQPQPQPQAQPASQNAPMSGIQWVQGEAAARAFHVDPGQSVLLMDSDSPVLYLKTCDISGRPSPMKTYDLVERTTMTNPEDKAAPVDLSEYVKRSEIEELIKQKMSEIKFTTSPAIINA